MKTCQLLLLCILLVGLMGCRPANSSFQETLVVPLPYGDELATALVGALDATEVAGVSAAVIIEGEGAWVGSTGYSYPGRPVTPDMLFDTGSAAGLRPGGVGWRDPSITNRYVLGQTYRITNRSAEPVTDLVFYQLLHSHPNDDPGPANFGVYDPTPYGTGGLPDFHYDITQYGSSLWNPPGTDITGFSAQDEPAAWGVGELPGHYGPPPMASSGTSTAARSP